MRLPPAVVEMESNLTPPTQMLGNNPVYAIEDPEDPRVTFFRLTKCRNHRYYSCLHSIVLKKGMNLVLSLTRTVVQRALLGYYEIVSLMLTPELLEEMKDLIARRRLIEGIYTIHRDNYEKIVGLIVNSSQACAALVDMRPGNESFSPPLPIPIDSHENCLTRYFWTPECPIGLDRKPEADILQTPIVILDDVGLYSVPTNVGYAGAQLSYSGINCRASRTSMGGLHFFSIFKSEDLIVTMADLKNRNITVLATSPRGEVLQSMPDDNWALILGNEEEVIKGLDINVKCAGFLERNIGSSY
eukprot:Gregarina_sp_Poly_1__10747@NODE_819_length_6147_cov_44_607072_g593_i0_p3_GENE_NODE_819_length_6147_cov_44_607072_g593_i0NODE_819_length_6147_cov_44_607072_g593_i0_p3_ORF_typecomplete_len301_score12_50SpoU_methylase/PF00588_19/5_1e03SpoU_methylase/PF00588_19/5_1e05_NODE_819_length_6147_cov_44_607072_g593_i07271629